MMGDYLSPHGLDRVNKNIRLKTPMLRTDLSNYGDAYICCKIDTDY